jgi:hypothetical protein
MGLFGNLAKLAMDVIETPISVVKDVVTMGGALTDQTKPYTAQSIEDIGKDWDKTKEDLGKDE